LIHQPFWISFSIQDECRELLEAMVKAEPPTLETLAGVELLKKPPANLSDLFV